MNVYAVKQFILENDLIEHVLMAIECHHIKNKGEYYTCGNRDGDNIASITVYKNENINVVNYTRDMAKGKRGTDIIDLVMFNLECSFSKALQFICDLFGLDYYEEIEEPPESIQILQLIKSMSINEDYEDKSQLKPINEKLLRYYLPYPNKMWEDDGISLDTQAHFGIMYDPQSNRIIVPLYDELDNLVALKGRLMKNVIEDGEQKYIYMTKFNKSKYVYGLHEVYDLIQQQGYVIVFESEKSVMLAYEHGIGAISIGGCQLSQYQVEIITRLNVKIIFALDKDRDEEAIIKECNKFLPQVPIWYVYDKDDILCEKESPIDDWDKFKVLKKNNTYKFKRKENE